MTKKLLPLLMVLVLGACAPVQAVDTGNAGRTAPCQCVKCQCQHDKKGACGCAHEQGPAEGKICVKKDPR